jgi:serine protease Do
VTVGQLEEADEKITLGEEGTSKGAMPKATSVLGLGLVPLNDEMRQQFGFDKKVQGLLVTEIDPESPAASKNIRVGDVIAEAQQEPVASAEALKSIIDKLKATGAKSVILLVEDAKGDTRFIGVPF